MRDCIGAREAIRQVGELCWDINFRLPSTKLAFFFSRPDRTIKEITAAETKNGNQSSFISCSLSATHLPSSALKPSGHLDRQTPSKIKTPSMHSTH